MTSSTINSMCESKDSDETNSESRAGESSYIDTQADFNEILKARGDRELASLYQFISEHFADGVFTLLDVGCGPANLTQRIALRYPKCQILAMDLDAAGSYAEDWQQVMSQHINIKEIWKGDMLDASEIRKALTLHLGKSTVDIVFGHASVMYLHDGGLEKFYRQCADFTNWIVTRDTTPAWNGHLVGGEDCDTAISTLKDALREFTKIFHQHGAGFPPCQADVENSDFNLSWYLEHMDYKSNDVGPRNLSAHMDAGAQAVVGVIQGGKSSEEIEKIKRAFEFFGRHGLFCLETWQVSILKNNNTL